MSNSTTPPIWEAQNSDASLRLLAAQRRTYSDAKVLHFVRVSIIATAGSLIAVSTFILNPFRPMVGAAASFVLLILSVASSSREKRKIESAAAIQERFDTDVFRIPWPGSSTLTKPSAADVARAALRHKGGNLQDWYGLNSPVARPLDVLICQRANLGWGIATHRAWAALTLWLGVGLLAVATCSAVLARLALLEAVVGIYAPLVPIFKELIDAWQKNSQSAKLKEEVDSEAAKLWNSSIKTKRPPSESQCRKLQDRILETRLNGALIPDWFNALLRKREESVMRLGTNDYVSQSREAGF
ncbi:S-4TM family putative pore-forming effector [Streptomyces sp. NBC_01077]|uniref:S-4TM family putative pore-forming effector n=1 Tax=Streptomyces sp. NBC_01077 TaxID=2903746 RepID=UPI003864CB9C|nr:S-4TM family putative pore-forming effector [Streptomyces sp. NBC_01077]